MPSFKQWPVYLFRNSSLMILLIILGCVAIIGVLSLWAESFGIIIGGGVFGIVSLLINLISNIIYNNIKGSCNSDIVIEKMKVEIVIIKIKYENNVNKLRQKDYK